MIPLPIFGKVNCVIGTTDVGDLALNSGITTKCFSARYFFNH